MHAYYCVKSWNEMVFIEKASNEQLIKNLFIYHDHHYDLYLRAKILDLFAGRKVCNMIFMLIIVSICIFQYRVLFLDLGYEYIADKNDLILNDNPEFLKLPIQGFQFGLRLDDADYQMIEHHPEKSEFNLAVQKIVLSSSDFWISFSKNMDQCKVNVFCKHHDQIIDLAKFIKSKINSKTEMVVTKNGATNSNVKSSEKGIDGHLSESIISSSSIMIVHPLLWESYAQFVMKVKQVTSPNDFYLKFIADPDYQKFKAKLQSYMTSNSIQRISAPKIGHVYGAIADHHRNKYIRVFILSFDDKTNEYNCFEMDKGMDAFYKSTHLYKIPEDLATFPARSVRASLYGINY